MSAGLLEVEPQVETYHARLLDEHLTRLEARSGSWAAYVTRRGLLRRWLRRHPHPRAWRAIHIERWAYLPGPSGKHPAANTVRNRIAAVAAFGRFLVRVGVLSRNPAEDIPRPQVGEPPPRGLALEEWHRLLAAVPRTPRGLRDRAIIITATMTALRRAELAALTPASLVERDGAWWYTVRTKGGRIRHHEFPAACLTAVELWLHSEGTSLRAQFQDAPLWGIGPDMILHLVRRYGRLAGLGRVTVHDLRHTAAKVREEAGEPLGAIQGLLGHRHRITTERYVARLTGGRDPGASAAAARLGLESPSPRKED
jgi:integrase/recombinase XerC